MFRISILIILTQLLLFISPISNAVPPVINKNVHVIQNATTAQCPTSIRGKVGEANVITYSGIGEQDDESAPGVRSCTGCAIDSQSGDCVCETCYDYFDNL
jgi:hypothetical protein